MTNPGQKSYSKQFWYYYIKSQHNDHTTDGMITVVKQNTEYCAWLSNETPKISNKYTMYFVKKILKLFLFKIYHYPKSLVSLINAYSHTQ